jgi:nicotinamidase-related amidase
MSNPTVWSAVLGGLPRYALDEPAKTALVVVDMQYLDAHPDYGLGKTLKERGTFHLVEGYFDRVKDATGVIAKLLDACRQTGIEVIYITIASRTKDGRERSRVHRDNEMYAQIGSREAAVLDEIAPQGDEIVLHKTAGGVFNSTEIDYLLHNLGIETLIMTGVVTNGCVETAVRDAADRSYKVILVPDACAAFTDELHENSLRSVGEKLCNLRTSEEVLAELAALPRRVTVPALA